MITGPGIDGVLPGRSVSPIFYVLGTAGILLLAALVVIYLYNIESLQFPKEAIKK